MDIASEGSLREKKIKLVLNGNDFGRPTSLAVDDVWFRCEEYAMSLFFCIFFPLLICL